MRKAIAITHSQAYALAGSRLLPQEGAVIIARRGKLNLHTSSSALMADSTMLCFRVEKQGNNVKAGAGQTC